MPPRFTPGGGLCAAGTRALRPAPHPFLGKVICYGHRERIQVQCLTRRPEAKAFTWKLERNTWAAEEAARRIEQVVLQELEK